MKKNGIFNPNQSGGFPGLLKSEEAIKALALFVDIMTLKIRFAGVFLRF